VRIMKQEDFLEKMPFGIIIDIDTNVRGMEHCSNNSPIFSNKDNKQDFTVTQDYRNNSMMTKKLNNITIKISVLS